MRVSQGLVDGFDGEINQTRTVAGRPVFFKRFSDRYSLIGFGRVTNWSFQDGNDELNEGAQMQTRVP